MPAALAPDGRARGLACSIAEDVLAKIEQDATKVKSNFPDVKILLFATPHSVTQKTEKAWKDKVAASFGLDLIVLPREDFITSLTDPANAFICRAYLGLSTKIDDQLLEDLGCQVREAATEEARAWMRRQRVIGRPLLLEAARLGEDERETGEMFNVEMFQQALATGQRILMESPGGTGKTTTLVQVAERLMEAGGVGFLIDLPEWAESGRPILEFIANSPRYQGRSISAKSMAELAREVQFSFLLNGWNEVSDDYLRRAGTAVARLEQDFPASGIVVATRMQAIMPRLPGSIHTRIRPLTRSQRSDFLKGFVRDRVLRMCRPCLSVAHRSLLSMFIAELGSEEALIIGLDLVEDSAQEPIPYELRRAIEAGFLEKRPYRGGSSYTLAPRSQNNLRSRLLDLALSDDKRKRSAANILGQIEVWRLKHGRPNDGPRRPAVSSSVQWPLAMG